MDVGVRVEATMVANLNVSAAGPAPIDIDLPTSADDTYILSMGSGCPLVTDPQAPVVSCPAGPVPTAVNPPSTALLPSYDNTGASFAEGYPLMNWGGVCPQGEPITCPTTGSGLIPGTNLVPVVDFPAAGTYPIEIDYTESAGPPYSMTVQVPPPGSLTINKTSNYSDSSYPVGGSSGATFTVTGPLESVDSSRSYSQGPGTNSGVTLSCTDSPCDSASTTLGDLVAGDYAVTETGAPPGYQASDASPTNCSSADLSYFSTYGIPTSGTQCVSVGALQTGSVTFADQVAPGSLTLVKEANDTPFLSLEGAQFSLTGPGLSGASTIVTDSTGAIDCSSSTLAGPPSDESAYVPSCADGTISGLYPGTYTATETVPPSGYQLADPPPSVSVAVAPGGTVEAFFPAEADQAVPGVVQIVKCGNDTPFLTTDGATFTVSGANAPGYTELPVTVSAAWQPSTGCATATVSDVLPGDVTVTEDDPPAGYQSTSLTETVAVEPAPPDTVFTFNDTAIPGSLTVVKDGDDTGNQTTAGATFTVTKVDAPQPSDASPQPTGGYTAVPAVVTVACPPSTPVGTPCNGASATLSNLLPGIYDVTENNPPDGYQPPAVDTQQVVVEPSTLSGPATVTFDDHVLPGSITIDKQGNDMGFLPTGGSEFSVYAGSSTAGQAVTTTTTSWDPTCTVGSVTGCSQATVDGLAPGNYTVAELTPPPGYTNDSEPQQVTVTPSGTVTATFGPATNCAVPGSIAITKYGNDTPAAPLTGAVFTVTGPAAASTGGPSCGGTTYTTAPQQVPLSWQASKDDATGTLSGLLPGVYTVTETTAPAGYHLPATTPSEQVTVEPGGQAPAAFTPDDDLANTVTVVVTVPGACPGTTGIDFALYGPAADPAQTVPTAKGGTSCVPKPCTSQEGTWSTGADGNKGGGGSSCPPQPCTPKQTSKWSITAHGNQGGGATTCPTEPCSPTQSNSWSLSAHGDQGGGGTTCPTEPCPTQSNSKSTSAHGDQGGGGDNGGGGSKPTKCLTVAIAEFTNVVPGTYTLYQTTSSTGEFYLPVTVTVPVETKTGQIVTVSLPGPIGCALASLWGKGSTPSCIIDLGGMLAIGKLGNDTPTLPVAGTTPAALFKVTSAFLPVPIELSIGANGVSKCVGVPSLWDLGQGICVDGELLNLPQTFLGKPISYTVTELTAPPGYAPMAPVTGVLCGTPTYPKQKGGPPTPLADALCATSSVSACVSQLTLFTPLDHANPGSVQVDLTGNDPNVSTAGAMFSVQSVDVPTPLPAGYTASPSTVTTTCPASAPCALSQAGLADLIPGTYLITETAFPAGYTGLVEPQLVSVGPAATTVVDFSNQAILGQVTVDDNGSDTPFLPTGGATVSISGGPTGGIPAGMPASLETTWDPTCGCATTTFTSLLPGTYVVTTGAASTGYEDPTPTTQSVTVITSETATADISEQALTGHLDVAVYGNESEVLAPTGATFTVTGPAPASAATPLTITCSAGTIPLGTACQATLSSLVPGVYTVTETAPPGSYEAWGPADGNPQQVIVEPGSTQPDPVQYYAVYTA